MMCCKPRRANDKILRLRTSKKYTLCYKVRPRAKKHYKVPSIILCTLLTTLWYKVQLRTIKCYSALQSTTPYYKVLQSISPYFVLQSTTLYYKVYSVLPSKTKHHEVLQSTKYYSVLQGTTRRYTTHEMSIAMRGATEVTLQHLQIRPLPRKMTFTLFPPHT